jgi:GT2 family glycosyltransferase
LAEQSYENWEIVLVTPGRDERLADLTAGLDQSARIRIVEGDLGVSQARNLGAGIAMGEIVAFIDDDAVATHRWLESIVSTFRAGWHIVGGPIIPIYLAKPGAWWNEEFAGYLGKNPEGTIYGGNLAVSKAIFARLGGFDPRLGMSEGRLLSNEEMEFLKRASEKGHRSKFARDIKVYHIIPASKLSFSYLMRRAFWQGISDVRLCWIEGSSQVETAYEGAREMIMCFLSFFLATCAASRAESVLELFRRLGVLTGVVGLPSSLTAPK